ncbi:LysR family transcriptional regulator [Amycolatopsis suaedae]|uniref:LysR family transcriptional regulator n=1 Tax=Amycolatopsis suaedae TaxID=2510978 RepID=A0A4Q7J279_9PSEU|nr:LysR family transcriptional regulator [Amycolatopsis suaedae]RZQ60503.1 LysR family transcriptional regulator [Amycolatopsis suaedae]
MIDLRRLQVLRVLADRGTVTEAARALHVTPSAVSQQLGQLARELDVELLARDGRGVVLTPAAHALLAHADELARRWELARADLAGLTGTVGGTVRLCGVSSALAAFAAPAVRILRQRHPRLRVRLAEEETGECYRLLLSGQSDVAVVLPAAASPPAGDPRFDRQVLVEDPQDLLVPAGHPLAGRAAVPLAAAAGEDWLVKVRDNDSHDLLVAACAAAGFTPRVAHEVKEWYAVSRLVAEGLGVCLLPRLVPVPADHAVVRVPLRGDPAPRRAIVAAVRRGSADHPAVAAVLTALREAGPVP